MSQRWESYFGGAGPPHALWCSIIIKSLLENFLSKNIWLSDFKNIRVKLTLVVGLLLEHFKSETYL